MSQSAIRDRIGLVALALGHGLRSWGEAVLLLYAIGGLNLGAYQWRERLVEVVGLVAVATILFAPWLGFLADRVGFRRMSVFSGLLALSVIGFCAGNGGPWPIASVAVVLASLTVAAARFAGLPDTCRRARWFLPRVQATLLLLRLLATLAAVWIAHSYRDATGLRTEFFPTDIITYSLGSIALGVLLSLLCRMAPSTSSSTRPLADTFVTLNRLVRSSRALGSTLLLSALWGLSVWMASISDWLEFGLALGVGVLLGGLHFSPLRTLGMLPIAVTLLAGSALYGTLSHDWTWASWGMAGALGWAWGPCCTGIQVASADDRRGTTFWIVSAWSALLLTASLFFWARVPLDATFEFLCHRVSLIGSCLLLVPTWWVFFRWWAEVAGEVLIWPFYVVRVYGPGWHQIRQDRPQLVFANHAAWFDPLWLAKVMPCQVVPMMVSTFYDLPVISWIMRRVYKVIRVQDSSFRREAPEIGEAIARLDQGDTVMIFPEGWLRRTEEKPIRRFARGIYEIVAARPQIVLIPCWIEGGWGSFTSFHNGPPTKGKRMDFFRTIRIAIGEPFVLDAETLQNHLQVRKLLLEKCVACRQYLGLPPLTMSTTAEADDGKDKDS